MKLALTYNNGMVETHFGDCPQFMLVDIENGKVVNKEIVDAPVEGHVQNVMMLLENQVNALICGNLGGHAVDLLHQGGVKIYNNIHARAEEAILVFLQNGLKELDVEHLKPSELRCDCHH